MVEKPLIVGSYTNLGLTEQDSMSLEKEKRKDNDT